MAKKISTIFMTKTLKKTSPYGAGFGTKVSFHEYAPKIVKDDHTILITGHIEFRFAFKNDQDGVKAAKQVLSLLPLGISEEQMSLLEQDQELKAKGVSYENYPSDVQEFNSWHSLKTMTWCDLGDKIRRLIVKTCAVLKTQQPVDKVLERLKNIEI